MPTFTVNIHAAKSGLSRLLKRVEKGESITIARDGEPVADLVPSRQRGRPPVAPEDPLFNLDSFAVSGPSGRLSNEDIDRTLYGSA